MAKTKRRKKFRKQPEKYTIWKYFKRYIEKSNIHGIKYLVEDNRHWTERLFWLVVCIMAWMGCAFLISTNVREFIGNKIAIEIDSTYLLWTLKFPAVHLCLTFSSRAKEYAIEALNIDRKKASQAARYTSVVHFGYDSRIPTMTTEQYTRFMDLIMPNCKDIFGVCVYSNRYFDCCQIFKPLRTTFGQCLSFNSLHAKHSKTDNQRLPDFLIRHYEPKSSLTVYINATEFWIQSRGAFKILITTPVTLPTFKGNTETAGSITTEKSLLFDISQVEIKNDVRIKSMPIKDRHCRFATEIDGYLTMESYSYEGCIEEHQMLRYNHLCGCVSHVYPTKGIFQVCNGTGTKCGFLLKETIDNVSIDACMPVCDEGVIAVFKHANSDENRVPQWATNRIEFNALPGPFIRYRRYTLHTAVDLVVAVGSAIGLFIGANVLSVAEIFYWLILRLTDFKLYF